MTNRIIPPAQSRKGVALYHSVKPEEDFAAAAQHLFALVQQAQTMRPNQKRFLYLDIEGHKDRDGNFDAEMLELQKEFLTGFLLQFLTEVYCPLTRDEAIRNGQPQNDDVPERLVIQQRDAPLN